MTPTLSKLEKCILLAIANHTINTLECEYSYEHDRGAQFIGNRDLFRACYDFWPDDTQEQIYTLPGDVPKTVKVRRVSFSRSLHRLKDKNLLGALALAWILLEGRHEDLYRWQGGGTPKVRNGYKDDVPRFSMLCLTEAGWIVARELGNPDLGKCNHTLHAQQRTLEVAQ